MGPALSSHSQKESRVDKTETKKIAASLKSLTSRFLILTFLTPLFFTTPAIAQKSADPSQITNRQRTQQVPKGKIDALIQKLNDKDWQVRRSAIFALEKSKDPRAVDALIKTLGNKDWFVRSSAAYVLGEIKDPRAVDGFIKALSDEEKIVREYAASALGEIKDTRAVDPLIKALSDKYRGVRMETVSALGKIKGPRAVDAISKTLEDKSWLVRRRAILALRKIKDPRAVDAIRKTLSDEWKDVREYAAEALNKIKAAETEWKEKEKQRRFEIERKAEEERIAKERLEKKLAEERAEAERIALIAAEKERIEQEKQRRERLAKEKAELERRVKELSVEKEQEEYRAGVYKALFVLMFMGSILFGGYYYLKLNRWRDRITERLLFKRIGREVASSAVDAIRNFVDASVSVDERVTKLKDLLDGIAVIKGMDGIGEYHAEYLLLLLLKISEKQGDFKRCADSFNELILNLRKEGINWQGAGDAKLASANNLESFNQRLKEIYNEQVLIKQMKAEQQAQERKQREQKQKENNIFENISKNVSSALFQKIKEFVYTEISLNERLDELREIMAVIEDMKRIKPQWILKFEYIFSLVLRVARSRGEIKIGIYSVKDLLENLQKEGINWKKVLKKDLGESADIGVDLNAFIQKLREIFFEQMKAKEEEDARKRQQKEEKEREERKREQRKEEKKEEKRKEKEEGQQRKKQGKRSYGYSNAAMEKAFGILELAFGASLTDVRKAYRKLAKRYHPDKHNNKSEKEKREYKEKIQKINDAYDKIKSWYRKEKGFVSIPVLGGLFFLSAGILIIAPYALKFLDGYSILSNTIMAVFLAAAGFAYIVRRKGTLPMEEAVKNERMSKSAKTAEVMKQRRRFSEEREGSI